MPSRESARDTGGTTYPKRRASPWHDLFCTEFGLCIVDRAPDTGAVESVSCRFCAVFGKENRPGAKRERSQNVKVFRIFRQANFRRHVEGQHSARWREYLSLKNRVTTSPETLGAFFDVQGQTHQPLDRGAGDAAPDAVDDADETSGGVASQQLRPQSNWNGAPGLTTAERLHVVSPSQTLWDIALLRTGDGARRIELYEMKKDHIIDKNALEPGLVLRIPPSEGSAEEGPLIYIVQPGDTLWGVAVAYLGDGARWQDIYHGNEQQIPNKNALQPGLRIRIPSLEEPSRPVIHVVQSGDSLWSIAIKYLSDGARWEEVYASNREQIPDKNILTPGQNLRIP